MKGSKYDMAGKGNIQLKNCNGHSPCGMTGARWAAPPQPGPQPQSGPQQGRGSKASLPSKPPPLRQNPKCLFVETDVYYADHSSGDQVSSTDNNNNWALITNYSLEDDCLA